MGWKEVPTKKTPGEGQSQWLQAGSLPGGGSSKVCEEDAEGSELGIETSECKHQLHPTQTSTLTRSSRWVDGVEKKKRNTRVVLYNDAIAVDISHATGPRRHREGVFPLDLASIKCFLAFALPSAKEELTTSKSVSIL